jgi:hypothetical protein
MPKAMCNWILEGKVGTFLLQAVLLTKKGEPIDATSRTVTSVHQHLVPLFSGPKTTLP